MTAPPSTEPASVGIQFVGLFTERLAFTELAPPEEGIVPLAPGERRAVGVQIQARIAISPDWRSAQTTLLVTATPDPRAQPYRVEISLSGAFRAPEGTTEAQLIEFAQRASPVILWPYARELIQRLTIDARYGPLRLDPIDVAGLLGQGVWEQGVLVQAPGAPAATAQIAT